LDEKDLQKGNRQKIISNALSSFQVADQEGELLLNIPNRKFGGALFNFVQAILKISDVTYLSRERVKSTFMEDFRLFIESKIPSDRYQFDWNDPDHDPEKKYIVDCRINKMERSLLIFALPNDDKVRDATISLLQFERWGSKFRSLGIFEDQEEANRKVLARFSDICEKQFSNLASNKDRVGKYLEEILNDNL